MQPELTVSYRQVRHDGPDTEKEMKTHSLSVFTLPAAQDFQYVDFASRGLRGFRNHIVSVNQLRALADRYAERDCFCTYYLFDSALLDYVRGNGGSVAGYQGPCDARFLPLDIDSDELERSLNTARHVCGFLLDRWGACEESVLPYFSGNKGFHITIATALFGSPDPSERLPETYQELRRLIVRKARLKYPDTVDLGIGDRLRLLRLPNTRHSKSGLYKVPLSLQELFESGPSEIVDLARAPRPTRLTDPTGLVPLSDVDPVPGAVDLYEQCLALVSERESQKLPGAATFLTRGELSDFLCEAEQRLYQSGVAEGARSAMALRFASRMRAAGYQQEEAARMVAGWNRRNRPPLHQGEARRIVKVAYASESPYEFGCGTGRDAPPHTRLVYEVCPYPNRLDCHKFRLFVAGAQRRPDKDFS